MKPHKMLIIDGLSRQALGTEFYQAMKSIFPDTYYISDKTIDKKIFYGIKRRFLRILNNKPAHYIYPKLNTFQIMKAVEEIQPTIVLVIAFSHRLVSKEYLQHLKNKYHFQLVLWDTDSANFGKTIEDFSAHFNEEFLRYDKIFSFSKSMAQYMEKLNVIPCEYLHTGSPDYKGKPACLSENKENIISFVGVPDLRRLLFLSAMDGLPLRVFGKKWKLVEQLLPASLKNVCSYVDVFDDKLYDIILNSKISLNITNLSFYGINSGIPVRVFLSISLGAFVLTDNNSDLTDLFVKGKEIETFSSHEELVDKSHFYLKQNSIRNKIAMAGQTKFLTSYTWKHQAKKMLRSLGVL